VKRIGIGVFCLAAILAVTSVLTTRCSRTAATLRSHGDGAALSDSYELILLINATGCNQYDYVYARTVSLSLSSQASSQPRQTLRELRSLTNIETYPKTARAELASDPCDERQRAFIAVVEALLREEKDQARTDGRRC
jgi:hypothetical protein